MLEMSVLKMASEGNIEHVVPGTGSADAVLGVTAINAAAVRLMSAPRAACVRNTDGNGRGVGILRAI
jgi:hypothetical protein